MAHRSRRGFAMVEVLCLRDRSIIDGGAAALRRIRFRVIELLNRLNGEPFSAYDMRVLSTIADFAAIAVEKSYYLAEPAESPSATRSPAPSTAAASTGPSTARLPGAFAMAANSR